MTQCTEGETELQLRIDFGLGKPVVGEFTGGEISSDGGLGLLRLADERLGLTERIAKQIGDKRQAVYIKHELRTLLQQRIYAIASGYEDGNDATQLRFDPMFRLCIGKCFSLPLASQPTISRLENAVNQHQNKLLQQLLLDTYIARHKKPPKKVILDIDTTCDEVHGYQQLSFYNGFYGTECYIPLFMFDQQGYPLLAVLRPGNYAPAEDVGPAIKPVIMALREAWPKTEIELRADAAFCNRDIYKLCEENDVKYFIGFKSNHALRCASKELIEKAKRDFEALFGPAEAPKGRQWRRLQERLRFQSKEQGRMQELFEQQERVRVIADVGYIARSWDRERRIICRVEYTGEGPELRFVITNASKGRPKWLYEEKYCKRGQCENWIKELKALHCDRLSCQEFEPNQFRLLLHCFAYILLKEVRDFVPRKTNLLSVNTIQMRFFKIGVLVRETVRRICLQWSSAYPWKQDFIRLTQSLQL
jgi:hypothetical protein